MARIADIMSWVGKYELIKGRESVATMRAAVVLAALCMAAVMGLWFYTLMSLVPRLPELVELFLIGRARGSSLRLPTEVYENLSWWMLAIGFAIVVVAAAFSYWSPWRSMLAAVGSRHDRTVNRDCHFCRCSVTARLDRFHGTASPRPLVSRCHAPTFFDDGRILCRCCLVPTARFARQAGLAAQHMTEVERIS